MFNARNCRTQTSAKIAAAARKDATAKWNTIDAARLGYLEVLRGRPFSPLYDGESAIWQLNYEKGRLWAASFLAVDGFAPAWKAQTSIPKALLAHVERVCHANGATSYPKRRTT